MIFSLVKMLILVYEYFSQRDMRLKAIKDSIISRMVKQNIDPSSLDDGKEQYASGNMIRKEIKIKEGIDKTTASKIRAVFGCETAAPDHEAVACLKQRAASANKR